MSQLDLCRTTCTLQRSTSAKDAAGGRSTTWTNVSGAVDVACDIQPVTSSTKYKFAQLDMDVTYTIYLPNGSDIGAKAGDRITSGGRTFKVQSYEKAAPGYEEWPHQCHVEEEPV